MAVCLLIVGSLWSLQWFFFLFSLNIYSRPGGGKDHSIQGGLDYANNVRLCLNTKNFDASEVYELRLILKRNPEKNLKIANKYFRRNPVASSALWNYDNNVTKPERGTLIDRGCRDTVL